MSRGSCPVSNCTTSTGAEMLMCKKHWWMVPEDLRKRIWRGYRKGAPDYHAISEAIAAVNAQAPVRSPAEQLEIL